MKKHLLLTRRIKAISVFILTLLLSTAFIHVSAKGSLVTGKILLDASPENSSGAYAELIDENGTIKDKVSVEQDGQYSFEVPDAGTYTVKLSAAGYLTASKTNLTLAESDAKIVTIPDTTLLCGDIDSDGSVTLLDRLYVYRLTSNSGFTSQYLKKALDVNKDGVVDDDDLALLNENFGKSAETSVVSESFENIRRNNYASYKIMSETGFTTTNNKDRDGMMQSGWSYDNRGFAPKNADVTPYPLSDTSTTEGTAHIRDLNVQENGVITLKTSIQIGGKTTDGAGIMFFSADEIPVYELITNNGYYCVRNANGDLTQLDYSVTLMQYESLYIVIDLDNGTSHTYIGGKDLGVHSLASDKSISHFKYFTTKEATNILLNHGAVYADVNYALMERFTHLDNNNVPFGWELYSSDASGYAKVESDELHLYSVNSSGTATEAKASFKSDRLSGNVIFEGLEYMSAKTDGLCLSLKYDGNDIVKLYTAEDGKFYANEVEVKDSYLANFWNILRIEADTDTNKAVIKINGKVKGTVDFLRNAPYIDSFELSLVAEDNTCTAKFDDIQFYQEQVVDDYVPEPIVPTDRNNYYVGINMCNLWQNGAHYGWETISAYSEPTPLIGFYDEDLPEVADWEIKFMVEHGIDFQAICWYPGPNDGPIKTTSLNEGLNSAYFNAKYSDMMDFALIWEANSNRCPSNLDDWKNYWVPYMIEYYLSDPRYARIDNKALIFVFASQKLYDSSQNPTGFGTTALCKEAFEYLEAECVKLGYDGCIFISNDTYTPHQADLIEAGFDAAYTYGWGKEGYTAKYIKEQHQAQYDYIKSKNNGFHFVPTISTGFNRMGWGDCRTPNLSTEDMRTLFAWVKETVLGNWYANETETWKKKLVMLSNWNEYGEGTYIMPSGLNGFGYVDEIRKAFTDDTTGTCKDTVEHKLPKDDQSVRIGYLYPQYRHALRPNLINTRTKPTPITKDSSTEILVEEVSFVSGTSTNTTDFTFTGLSTKHNSNKNAISCYKPLFSSSDTQEIVLNDPSIIDPKAASAIKIRAQIPAGKKLTVEVKTLNKSTYDIRKTLTYTLTSDSYTMTDYVFDFSDDFEWRGTIESFKITSEFSSYSISSTDYIYMQSIQLITYPTVKMYIDGNEYLLNKIYSSDDISQGTGPSVSTYTEPYIDNGHILIPFHPDMGINYMLQLYYTWDYEAGTLRLRGCDDVDITYTMDSSTALVNGEAVDLDCTPYIECGLPMIPIEHLIDCLEDGYSFAETTDAAGNIRYDVTTPYNDMWNVESFTDGVGYKWEFDHVGNLEGWSYNSKMELMPITDDQNNGVLLGASSGKDPIMTSSNLDINPKEYNKVVVRLKADVQSKSDVQVFYTGVKGSTTYSFAEARSIPCSVNKGNNGKYITYVFDFNSDAESNYDDSITWSDSKYHYMDMDKITQLRVDPIGTANSKFEIDYIYLVKSDYVVSE